MKFSSNVWAGIINPYLVGSYIIEETLSSQKCIEFLRDQFPTLLDDIIPYAIRRRRAVPARWSTTTLNKRGEGLAKRNFLRTLDRPKRVNC